ncbi:MAG: hypothetical protein L3J23_02935 [Flavobacteriaceae bacterium]|nr:hypothetical protein [Flavobacteriaceae bacterium]
MKKIVIYTLYLGLFNLTVKAQNFENLLASGKQDASTYIGNYMEPVFKGLISNLNNGWYHTGKTHKLFGFDFSINTSAAFVPNKDKTFTFNNDDYSFLELQNGNTSENLPTVMGDESNTLILVNNRDLNGNIIPNEFLPSFETLNGIEDEIKIAAIPTPMIQFGFGLPTKTDIKLRFVPSVGGSDVKFNLFGIGLQHNLLQHFLKLDKVPIIDLSILGAYTTSTILYTPEDSNIGTNQKTTIKVNAFTAQLVGNINLKIINFYAGLGYVAGNASTVVKGNYAYNVLDNLGVQTGGTVNITDPIDIDYKLDRGVKATLGMRLNLLWFKIFADYSVQEYNTLNAGLAFSFR